MTTDAPFRETETAIAAARSVGAHAVEMEAAALYAYATARQRDVVCVAHVTNSMATAGDDFDKGEADALSHPPSTENPRPGPRRHQALPDGRTVLTPT